MRRSLGLTVLVLVSTLLVSCTGGAKPAGQSATGGTPAWRKTAAADGAAPHVASHGWEAVLNGPGPARSTLVLESPERQEQNPAATAALSDLQELEVTTGTIVHLDISGGELPPAGAVLTRHLAAAVPEGTDVSLAYYDPAHDAWTAVPTALSDDRMSLTATVDHFSLWTDIADKVTYGLGWVLDTRVAQPHCDGAPPDWVPSANITYLDDMNAPLRWCVGRDPKNSGLLVVKVAVNRAYGVSLTPKAATTWIWDSLFQGGTDDVIVGLYAGTLLLPNNYGSGMLLAPGGAEIDLAFSEDAVRKAGGSPLVVVDPAPEYMVAGLTYTAITKQLSEGDRAGAAVAALLAIAQCGSSLVNAVRNKDVAGATHAALRCLTDNADDMGRDLATVLSSALPKRGAQEVGRLAGRVGGKLWQVWAAGLVFGVGTWFADRALSPAAWSLQALPKVQRPPTWASNSLTITSHGLGGVTIGMTVAAALKATGVPMDTGSASAGCPVYGPSPGPEGSYPPLMFAGDGDSGVFMVGTGNQGPIRARTPEGIGPGSTTADVLRVYGGRASEHVDIYGSDVVLVDMGDGTGYRFDAFGGPGTALSNIQAGVFSTLDYVELCG
jgi:hypothetical protein